MHKVSYSLKTGDKIEIPIPDNYRDCILLAKSDEYRMIGRIPSTMELILNLFNPKKINRLFWFRMCQYHGCLYYFCKIIYKHISRKRNVVIPTQVKAGYGLYLGHTICMVINEDTIIGNNVNLSQFLNIGTNNGKPGIIGDMVYVAPFVSIV